MHVAISTANNGDMITTFQVSQSDKVV